MKFIANAKEIKVAIDKVMTVINKKVPVFALKELYFEADVENNKVYVMGTDVEQYLKVEVYGGEPILPGVIGMDYEDIKILTKINGTTTLENENEKLKVVNINKIVQLKCYENFANDISFPDMVDKVEKFNCSESWLLETTLKLYTYLSCNDAEKLMQCFNFNFDQNRVEALDGHRIGMRTLENINVMDSGNLMVHGTCCDTFKKVLNKKSDNKVSVFHGKRYIEIVGETFTYWIKNVEGKYFNTDEILKDEHHMSFNIGGKELKEVCEYDNGLNVKNEKACVVLDFDDNTVDVLFKNAKYKVSDTLEITDSNVDKNFRIGFNPQFLIDVVGTIDTSVLSCKMSHMKAPMMIHGNEYSFIILPMNINVAGY